MSGSNRWPPALLLLYLAALAWSGWHPRDRFTWLLEVLPTLIAAPILVFTYRRFRFTSLAYALITLHAVILLVGGHYTYTQVPLGEWLRDSFGLARNHYDRLGHLAQGFVPAIVARELLLRTSPLRPGRWLSVLVCCVALAISAAYELVEWIVAISTGSAAEAFLALQGDAWDTQKDMALALIGALLAQMSLARVHDRALGGLPGAKNSSVTAG